MEDDRTCDSLSRRAALMISALAPALNAQQDGKPTGRPVVHFEIGCRDRGKTADYYSKLFGWNITAAGPAHNIDTGSKAGIQGHITSLGHEPQHYTTFYVEVEDVKAALDQAVALGGKKLVGPVPIPTGAFGWFMDPDGNVVGVITSKKSAP